MGWARRSTIVLAVVLLGLFVGQWLVTYLEGSWWAGAVSAGALTAFSRQTVLGLALEGFAISLGFVWWVWHFRFIALAAIAVPADGEFGNPRVRQIVQGFQSRPWAVLLCVVLAVLFGSGLSAWTETVLLAWEGVRFGVVEPALGYDVGFYVTRLPLALKIHALGTILVVATIGVTLPLHLLLGSIRLGRGVTEIQPAARMQIGILAAALAALLAVHQILLPLQLAAGLPHPVAPDLVRLYRSVSFVLVGVALAVTALSLIWSQRPIHGLVGGAWFALTLALGVTSWLLPSGEGWPESEADHIRQTPFDSLAFDLPTEQTVVPGTSSLSLWDGISLGAFETSGAFPEDKGATTPIPVKVHRAGWVWVKSLSDGGASLRVARGDTADSFGRPILSWTQRLPPSSAYPGAAGLTLFEGLRGVRVGGFPRRLALAWSLQSWSIVTRDGDSLRAAWDRDPVVRLSRLAPIALWRRPQFLFVDGTPTWVVNGILVSETFPVASRRSFAGGRVSYARAGLVGLVDALDGATRVFLAPDADSLAYAVSRIWSGLIQPASAIPVEARERLAYEPDLFALHARIWSEQEARRLGLDTAAIGPLDAVPGAVGGGAGPGFRQAAVADRRSDRIFGVLEGWRGLGGNRVVVYRPDSVGLELPDALARRWARLPAVQLARDSVTANGGSFEPTKVRYAGWDGGLIAYQPLLGVTPGEDVSLLGVGIAWRNRIGVGRTFTEAWRSVSRDGTDVRPGVGESDDLFEARRWMLVADSALARGDLVTFGRAFAALRRALEGGGGGEPQGRTP